MLIFINENNLASPHVDILRGEKEVFYA